MDLEPRDWSFFPKQEDIEVRDSITGTLRGEPELPTIPSRKQLTSWEPHYTLTLNVSHEQWLAERSRRAMIVLRDCVEATKTKLGGIPVVTGTRFSVSQLFSELADSDAIQEIAENFEVDEKPMRKLLHALSVYLDRPVYR